MQHTTFEFEGAFSFGQSKRSQWYILQNKQIPGPGTHELIKTRQSPAWSQGRDKKSASFVSTHTKFNAPVGCYLPKHDFITPDSKKYSVGKSKRHQKLNDITKDVDTNPNLNLTKESSPFFSFGYSQNTNYNNGKPAPNQYNQHLPETKKQFNRTQNYFTSASRYPPYGQQFKNPGIGNYNVISKNTNIPIQFGKSIRPPNEVSPDSPGKFYEISKSINEPGIGYSLAEKFPIVLTHEDFPPPGTYNPVLLNSRARIFTMTAKRSQMVNKQDLNKPSPGKYEIRTKLDKGIGFCQQKRPQLKVPVGPGPGEYREKSSLNNLLGKMAWRCPKQRKLITPSPQDYNPNHSVLQRKSQEGLTYYSNRVDFSVSDTKQIGPGAYNISSSLGKSLGRMGNSDQRPKIKSKTPGPGQYHIPPTIGKLPNYLKNINRKIKENGDVNNVSLSKSSLSVVQNIESKNKSIDIQS